MHSGSGMGSTSFPMTSFYVLSMLTTGKRQWTYLKMTVILRERKMANIRQKKNMKRVFHPEGPKKSLELSVSLCLQAHDLPPGYLIAIYISQEVYLAARVEIRWDL